MNVKTTGAGWIAIILVAAVLGLVAGCASKDAARHEYYCPMHPTYVSDRPGDCPICNMKLVPRERGVSDPGKTDTNGTHRILYYRNPMDPSVTSPVPMKDAMGMDYVPVYADEKPAATEPVEGYATVEAGSEAIDLAGIQVAVAERKSIARHIRAVGEVKADETRIRQVSLKSGGWIEKLWVNFNGQAVRKGQPLLSLYSPELLASQREFLEAREAANRFASSDLEEVRRGGADLLDAARRRLSLFDVPEDFIAELERSGQPQRGVTIKAPVGGSVTGKEVYEGSRVEPGMVLFTITDLSKVWIEGDVYEYEAPAIQTGQTATLSLAYDPGRNFTGRLAYIYPYLNAETRTLRVRFEADNPDQFLKPGMYANIDLALDPTSGVLIPDSAILDTGTRQILFVETSPGRFEPREVKVGTRADGMAEILSGLEAGERAVVSASFLLDSESRLRAAVAASSPAPGDTTGGAR